MKEFIESLNGPAWTAIITFLTTYGGTMLAFVISFIRTRIKNIDLDKTVSEMEDYCNARMIEQAKVYQAMLDEKLANMEKSVMVKVSDNEDARTKAVEQASADFEEALNDLKKEM